MKFNTSTIKSTRTVNHEGAVAYKLSPELELYSTVVTASLENRFYESRSDTLHRIQQLVRQVSPEFVAKLAIYARTKMYLRSVPLVLIVELAKIHNGDDVVSRMIQKTILRADEITELLAYYQDSNSRTERKKLNKLSKQIQKGLMKVYNTFNEYSFAKYNRKTEIKLKDVLFLSHPKPDSIEQQAIFDKIVNDNLDIPYTWETELSESGKNGKSKKQVWEELIDSRKVGYMALLRNLRNILDANVSIQHIQKVVDRLQDKNEVLNSKQLPFRFLSAYRELQDNSNGYTGEILESLENAVKISIDNVKGFGLDTSVVIACDVSGSMETPISERSKVEYYDIGLMLGMLLRNKSRNVITGIFGDEWKTKSLAKDGILRNVGVLHKIEGEVGYGTEGYKVIRWLNDSKKSVDKIMIFTDCEMYGGNIISEWSTYRKNVNPNSKLYLFNVDSYGTTPLKVDNNGVYLISGWSEKVFDVMDAIENGGNTLDEINKIDF